MNPTTMNLQKIDVWIERLATETDAAAHGEEVTRFLAMLARFWTYSARNCYLIVEQRPTATRVASRKTWASLGRTIKPEEQWQALQIVCPHFRIVRDADTGDDDCAHYWFAADVAYALRDLYDDRIERIDLEDPRLRAFVAGYSAVRPLPERDPRLLPLFMRAHNLYWFARLYRSIAEGEVPGEPPWATDLRATFVGMMNEFRDGFERHPVRQYVTDLPSRPRVPANPTLAALCCLAANRACLLVDPGARRLYHRR